MNDKEVTQIIAKSALKYFIASIITAFICLLLFSSCVATKKQKERFLANNCQRKDSVSYIRKDSLIYRDSLIYINTVVNEPIYLENPCKLLCDSLGRLKPINVVKSTNGLKSTVKSVGNSIVFECETDSLKARISWLERRLVISETSHTENTVKIPCELKHRTKWDGFTFYWFWITLAYFIIRYGWKFVRGYFMV